MFHLDNLRDVNLSGSSLVIWLIELSPDSICISMLYIDSSRFSSLVFDMFLEKTKLKDDSSNDAEWVCYLRIILIAA